MRILHVVEAFGGGVFNYIRDLAAWQSKEHEVFVLFNSLDGSTPKNYETLFPPCVTLISSDLLDRTLDPFRIRKATREIKKTVDRVAPDLVHLHSAFAGMFGRLALKGGQPVVLYSPHAYSFLPAEKRMSPKKRIFYYAEKMLGKRNCITVCVCDSEYKASASVTKQRICINSGIDTDAFQRLLDSIGIDSKPARRGRKSVVMTGRICVQKRPELFNEIAQKMPALDFIWVGDGPLRDRLNSKNVEVTGWLERSEVLKKVADADVFLFPTEYETISIALLEAMYLERPCVVSNVSGNCDVIVSGNNGYLCDDVSDYCAAIKEVLEAPEKAAALGQQARADVIAKYSTEAMEKAYKQFFTSLGGGLNFEAKR